VGPSVHATDNRPSQLENADLPIGLTAVPPMRHHYVTPVLPSPFSDTFLYSNTVQTSLISLSLGVLFAADAAPVHSRSNSVRSQRASHLVAHARTRK
jgi:hypothetical protein